MRRTAVVDLSFEIVEQFRPFELLAPGFVAVDLTGPPGRDLQLAESGPVAPFVAVEVDVDGGPAEAGLATPDGDQVLVCWSPDRRRLTLEIRRGGRRRVVRRKRLRFEGGRLAFALCENQVTGLVDTGAGWQPVLTTRDRVAALVDLRAEAELARYRYAYGGAGVTGVRAGLFGMTGLRDPHVVQNADGTPYLRDGRIHLTWTCAGLGFFQQAHWSVWSLDPAAPADMRLEAHLFTRRDGLVLGDHAGQLVRDGDRWLVATSSWGDFTPGSIHVRHTETTADLLSGVHLLETVPTALPTDAGTWDPSLTRVDGSWRVAFVESPSQDPFDFHPALARTGSPDWTDALERVGAADDLHQCEGPILATVGDTTWLLASDGHARHYPVLDLEFRRVGQLDAPYPSNIPHPQLVPDGSGGWLLVTFEGTQYAESTMGYGGHGDVVVMRSR